MEPIVIIAAEDMAAHITEQHLQAVVKAERHGVDALTVEERSLYDEALEMCGRLMRQLVEGVTGEQSQTIREGLEAYTRLSPADQARYQEWTARELLAFLPLIDTDASKD